MNFYVMTLFPEMIEQGIQTSILGRAIANGHISLEAVNIRDYTENKHKKVDDYPYGGGAGMLIQAQPVYACYEAIKDKIKSSGTNAACEEKKTRVVYLTPQGTTFQQNMAQELAGEENLVFLCGHYEGIDERVLEEIVTDYVSIGDYVLTGGELPAMVMIDAIARLVPGVLHNEVSADFETFHNDLLEYPQYSRPESWHDKKVPDVLLSGDHKKIAEWRRIESETRTKMRRPDLYKKYSEKQHWIQKLLKKGKILYMDTIESLKRGRGEIIYASDKGILVCDRFAKVYFISAFGDIYAKEVVEHIPEQSEGWQYVVHQSALLEPLKERFSIGEIIPMRQVVHTQKVTLPVPKNIGFQQLGAEYLDEILAHYKEVSDKEYLRERLQSGSIYGAFMEDRLVGFAGVHQEGSLGMLEVYEEYRRRGVGRALEAYMINQQLALGYTPYANVKTENDASTELQHKLKLCVSKEVLYWVKGLNY